MRPIKHLKKDGTKRRIKQILVRHIIYQQGIFKRRTKKLNKEIEKVLWKIGLLGFIGKK
jgi:hypothetical protein